MSNFKLVSLKSFKIIFQNNTPFVVSTTTKIEHNRSFFDYFEPSLKARVERKYKGKKTKKCLLYLVLNPLAVVRKGLELEPEGTIPWKGVFPSNVLSKH